MRQLHPPKLIRKCRKNTKGMSRRQCPSRRSIWRIINLHKLGVIKTNKVWKTLFNIYKMTNLWNIFFVRSKFFTCKMEEDSDLLDHINKVKALVDCFACLKCLCETNILPPFFIFFIFFKLKIFGVGGMEKSWNLVSRIQDTNAWFLGKKFRTFGSATRVIWSPLDQFFWEEMVKSCNLVF